MNLHKEEANFVQCPMIKESPVSVECKVKEIKELGSHHMFVADVLAINADEKFIDETQKGYQFYKKIWNGNLNIRRCMLAFLRISRIERYCLQK